MKANKSFRNSQSGKISDVQFDSTTIQNMF